MLLLVLLVSIFMSLPADLDVAEPVVAPPAVETYTPPAFVEPEGTVGHPTYTYTVDGTTGRIIVSNGYGNEAEFAALEEAAAWVEAQIAAESADE
jgi:hypothetical protein